MQPEIKGKIPQDLMPLATRIDTLNIDPENANMHGDRSLQAIAASIERFGFDQPVVVQKEGMIVRKGNGRLLAAQRLGWSHVPALIVDECRIAAIARAIADNRSNEFSRWDEEMLVKLLEEVREDIPLEDLGFDSEEVSELLMDEEIPNLEDDGEEFPSSGVSEMGVSENSEKILFQSSMSEKQHKILRKAIEKAKEEFGEGSAKIADCLELIATFFLENHDVGTDDNSAAE